MNVLRLVTGFGISTAGITAVFVLGLYANVSTVPVWVVVIMVVALYGAAFAGLYMAMREMV